MVTARLDVVRRRPAVTLAVTVAAIAVLMTLGGRFGERLSDPVGHALSHLFVGLPVAVLLAAVLRAWPPPRRTRPGPWARRLAVVGLSGIVVGQLLEIVGARVDEPGATALEGAAHTAGMVVSMLSFLTAVVAGALALVAAAREGAVPRWVAALLTVLLVAVFAVMVFGSPDPNA